MAMLNSISKFLKIPNTSEYEQRTYFIVALIVASVTYYDLLVVKISPSFTYFLTRFSFIILPYLYAHLFKNSKFGKFNNEFFIFNYFNYSFFFSYFYNYAYIIAFAQFALGMAGVITISKRFYNYLVAYGVILTYSAIFLSPQFDNSSASYDIQSVYANSMFYVFLVSFFVYHRVVKVRDDAYRNELLFADMGKKLSVVIHELQGTLRSINNSPLKLEASKDLQDIQEISCLMNILTSKSHTATQTPFEISNVVSEVIEQNSGYIEHFKIELSKNMIDVRINNDLLAFKIIIKNIIKNAIEASTSIDEDKRKIFIELNKSSSNNDFVITITNRFDGKVTSVSEIKKPFITTKSNITNRGLGFYIIGILCDITEMKYELKINDDLFSVILTIPSHSVDNFSI